MTIWWQSWFEQLIRSREDNGSAQLYLLYLSLTAVGVVLLLAISLYCRFTISVFLALSRNGFVCSKFYPNSSNWLNILVARCWKVFLSVRRKPELPPTQYLVEGSCTLPRIDGLQGYTLPRWVTWIPCYLVTWFLVTWLPGWGILHLALIEGLQGYTLPRWVSWRRADIWTFLYVCPNTVVVPELKRCLINCQFTLKWMNEVGCITRVSEGGGYTLRLHAEDGGTLTREATVTYWFILLPTLTRIIKSM